MDSQKVRIVFCIFASFYTICRSCKKDLAGKNSAPKIQSSSLLPLYAAQGHGGSEASPDNIMCKVE